MATDPSERWGPLVFWKKSSHPIRSLVQREFGLRIRNIDLYTEAFTHSSMLEGDTMGLSSNERLEFLGDSALDLVVASFVYRSFPDEQEGPLTQRKSKIVSRETLNWVGEKMQLRPLIQSKMRKVDVHATIVGNTLEALIGSIYLDHGYEKMSKAVIRMLKRYGVDYKVQETIDFKSKLYLWGQREKASLSFEVIREYHVHGKTCYDIDVNVNGVKRGSGSGNSKKSAEQEAARNALSAVLESSDLAHRDEKENPSRS